MKYRRLGSSDLDVSVLAFGAWQLGGADFWGETPETDAQRAVDLAIDNGVNFFDTAEMYGQGESERVLGKVLGRKRQRVYVASKVWPDKCAPAALRNSCEASLRRLRTDVIDLYQVHWPSREVPFADTWGELERLRKEGKIRHIGVSNFGARDLDAWMAAGGCVSNQLGYNLIFRAIEHEILPACKKHGIGVLAYMPVMQGLLTGRYKSIEDIPVLRRRTRHFSSQREGTRHGEPGAEKLTLETLRSIETIANEVGAPMAVLALAWVMAQSGVASAIIGARNPEQLERNLMAADFELDAATLRALDNATSELKDHFGANADMWLGVKESRIR